MKNVCDIVSVERRVINMLFEEEHLSDCFSKPNEEQFDQTFRKFVVKTYFKEITKG